MRIVNLDVHNESFLLHWSVLRKFKTVTEFPVAFIALAYYICKHGYHPPTPKNKDTVVQ